MSACQASTLLINDIDMPSAEYSVHQAIAKVVQDLLPRPPQVSEDGNEWVCTAEIPRPITVARVAKRLERLQTRCSERADSLQVSLDATSDETSEVVQRIKKHFLGLKEEYLAGRKTADELSTWLKSDLKHMAVVERSDCEEVVSSKRQEGEQYGKALDWLNEQASSMESQGWK